MLARSAASSSGATRAVSGRAMLRPVYRQGAARWAAEGSPPEFASPPGAGRRRSGSPPERVAAGVVRRAVPARVSFPNRATRRDPPARGPQRLPAAAGGQGRGRRRPGAHLARIAGLPPTGRRSTSPDPCPCASGRTRWQTSWPGPGGSARTTASTRVRRRSTGPRTPAAGSSPGPGSGAERARLIAEAAVELAGRSVSPARRVRLTRPRAAWWRLGGADRGGPRHAARPGSATPTGGCPVVSITGTNGKSTVTRLITHILLLAGHHVGTTTSDGILVDERMVEAGRLDRPGRRCGDPAPGGRGRRRPRDRARWPRARGHGLRVQRGQRVHQRLLGPPRPPGHPHAAGARRGQGDGLPGHEARRLGRAQRRRPARRRRRAPGSCARGATSRWTPAPRWSLARHRRAGGRAWVLDRRPAGRVGRAPPSTRLLDVADLPDRPGRPRAPQRGQRAGGGGRRAGAGRDAGAGRRRPARLPPVGRAVAGPAQPVPARPADGHRGLRPQRGRHGGDPRRRGGDRRRAGGTGRRP